MGRKVIDTSKKIADTAKRNVTFSKRKKGLIKKNIELSNMCDRKIFTAIYDERTKKMVIYHSHENFDAEGVLETIK